MTVVQVPSNQNIPLREGGSVLLQFHIQGEVRDARSTVNFGGATQETCTGRRNYIFDFESKPLVKNTSRVCDQAYWSKLDQHRQKYEVRVTNGEAARGVHGVTILLQVYYLDGSDHTFRFEVTLLKFVAMTTAEKSSTAMPTEELTTTPTEIMMTTPTEIMMTTPTEEITTMPTEVPKTTEIDLTSAETQPRSTVAATDTVSTIGVDTSSPSTPPTTTPTNSVQGQMVDFLKESKQNQVTLAVGVAALLAILVEFAIIVFLIKNRRTRSIKSTSQVDSLDTSSVDDKEGEDRV